MGMVPNLPVYKLIIRPDAPQTGAEFVAFVDEPAIEKYFVAFGNQSPETAKPLYFASEEQRIISSPILIPDKPIFRKAMPEVPHDHYVLFDADTIRQVLYNFSRQGNFNNVNLMHEPGTEPDGVYMIESFLSDSKRGISAPEAFKDLPDGTWFLSYKVDNDAIWGAVKNQTFRGLSIEGIFAYVKAGESPEEKLFREIGEILKS